MSIKEFKDKMGRCGRPYMRVEYPGFDCVVRWPGGEQFTITRADNPRTHAYICRLCS